MRKGTTSISTTAPAECFASPEPLPILTGHAHHKGPEIADPERSVPWCRYSELAKNRGATIAATKPCSKLWHEVVARWLNLGEPLKHRGQEAVPHTCLYDLLLHSNILTYMYVGMSCGHKTQSKNKHDLRYQLYCIYIYTLQYTLFNYAKNGLQIFSIWCRCFMVFPHSWHKTTHCPSNTSHEVGSHLLCRCWLCFVQ